MMYNDDVLDNYEKALRQANEKLRDATEQMDKAEEMHKEELQNVRNQFLLL